MTTRTVDFQGTSDIHDAAAIAPFASLSAASLRNVRRMYEALTPTRDTLAVLYTLDAAQTEPTEAWITFFVETASAQLIWDERPTGRLSEDDARWVVARYDEAPTLAAMAVLARLAEEAPVTPAWFAREIRQRAGQFAGGSPSGADRRPPYLRLVA